MRFKKQRFRAKEDIDISLLPSLRTGLKFLKAFCPLLALRLGKGKVES